MSPLSEKTRRENEEAPLLEFFCHISSAFLLFMTVVQKIHRLTDVAWSIGVDVCNELRSCKEQLSNNVQKVIITSIGVKRR